MLASKENLSKSLRLVKTELKKIKETTLTKHQLIKARQQFYGQLAASFDNQENFALGMAKSMLVYKKVDSLEQILAELNEITAEDIQRVANDLFDEEKLTTLIYT